MASLNRPLFFDNSYHTKGKAKFSESTSRVSSNHFLNFQNNVNAYFEEVFFLGGEIEQINLGPVIDAEGDDIQISF